MMYIYAFNEEFCMYAMNVCTRNDAIRARSSSHLYTYIKYSSCFAQNVYCGKR